MAWIPTSLLDALPASARAAFEAAYPDVPDTAAVLGARIDAHLASVDRALANNEFVDRHLAEVIAHRLRTVLDAWDALDADDRRILHTAIAYYALRDDAEDDMTSVLGFEDDARVVNVCLRALGRSDLEIDLD